MSITVKSESEVDITPKLMAEAFWAMSDEDQADFFEHLAKEIKSDKCPGSVTYGLGERQWVSMHETLKKRGGIGLQMYYALSVFAFEFSQDHCGFEQRLGL